MTDTELEVFKFVFLSISKQLTKIGKFYYLHFASNTWRLNLQSGWLSIKAHINYFCITRRKITVLQSIRIVLILLLKFSLPQDMSLHAFVPANQDRFPQFCYIFREKEEDKKLKVNLDTCFNCERFTLI